MNRHFDLIAIGGGSGGLAVAETAAKLGKRVALVETGAMGGTCVNRGCVPKKLMWYAAELARAVDDAPGFGIPASRGATDWALLRERREHYVRNIKAYWDGYVADIGITHIQGHARFCAERQIEVAGEVYSAEHIVIATGGVPIIPNVPGPELGIGSDGFFALEQLPRRCAVIGGGYIGVELAGVLSALGSEVDLLALEQRVLAEFDPLLGEQLMKAMRAQGIELHMKQEVTSLAQGEWGVHIHTRDGGVLEGFDTVIWAVGRRPNTHSLNLKASGLAAEPNASIAVDANHRTQVPGVYAIGDVTGKAALTPVAIAAGRRLGEHLFNERSNASIDYGLIPSVVFAHPPVGRLGLTEPEARSRFGEEVTVYQSRFTPMRHALSTHGGETAMKLVCAGSEERVVGLHLIGDNVDEILQGFAVAVSMGARKADLDATLAIHPSSAEELVTLKTPAPTADDMDKDLREVG